MSAESGVDLVEVRLRIPRVWHDRLGELAVDNASSLAVIVRIALREFLYGKREAA